MSTTGSDDNPGTKARPFRSIDRVNTEAFSEGDTLYFRANDIFPGTLRIRKELASRKRFLVTSFGKGRATLDGGLKEALVFEGSGFALQNIDVKGAGRKGGNTTDGIYVKGANILIERVRTEGFQKCGLQLFDCTRAMVKSVTARYNGFSGILVSGSVRGASRNILIQDCTASDNPGDPSNLTNHSGNGILVGFADSVLIDHCVATRNGWDMPRIGNGPVGIWAYESNRVTIQYCISYRNRTSKGGKDGGGFDFDGGMTNSVMQYCLSYGNEGAGYGLFQYAGASAWHNDTVRYCVSINDATTTEGSGSIFMWNGDGDTSNFRDCLVYQNLFYNTFATAIQFEPESANNNFRFYNNIILGSGNVVNGPGSGDRFIGNAWWPSKGAIAFRQYNSLKQWVDSAGQETWNGQVVGKEVNPLLRGPMLTRITNPYRLRELLGCQLSTDSPLKNQGLDLQLLFGIPNAAHDFFGKRVPLGSGPEPGVAELE